MCVSLNEWICVDARIRHITPSAIKRATFCNFQIIFFQQQFFFLSFFVDISSV